MADDLEEKVIKANKDFYNIIGSYYESIDGRRSERLKNYIRDRLKEISSETDGDALLDLGCGNGLITLIGKQYFKKRYALDVSSEVMKTIDDLNVVKIVADFNSIPLEDESISAVATFAVLHHCYSYERIIGEIYRVLKKGGIYYSDHDMDFSFFNRFKILMKIYRSLNDASRRYMEFSKALSKDLYHLTEFHSEGISTDHIVELLRMSAFKKITVNYHWYGLNSLTDVLFGEKHYKKGLAPIVRIIAVK